jgi:hypothetical protein
LVPKFSDKPELSRLVPLISVIVAEDALEAMIRQRFSGSRYLPAYAVRFEITLRNF